MYRFSAFIVGLFLASAECVIGGSRLWEAKAPNMRTNPSPDYPAIDTLNNTSPLVRRAISIADRPGDNQAASLWPGKRVKYCFENENARIRGLWESAIETWAQLKDAGFTYEKVSQRDCSSKRSSVLRIYYNDQGRLASTLGIPYIDASAVPPVEGPSVHLSDMTGIGQDNVQANVAHELGHVWGLHHEHQNPYWWTVSSSDLSAGWSFPTIRGVEAQFQTSDFKCRNLKDYGTTVAKMEAMIRAAEQANDQKLKEKIEFDLQRICISQQAASDYGFSASEWLPLSQTTKLVADDNFDPDSLMMYPSGAGGTGLSNGRSDVMIFKNGARIPNRISPTGMDIERLVTLYGNTPSSKTGVPHTSKSSGVRVTFRRARSRLFRAGDTKDGLC